MATASGGRIIMNIWQFLLWSPIPAIIPLWWWDIVLWGIVIGLGYFSLRDPKSRLRSEDGPWCDSCDYSLKGRPDVQLCPECGKALSVHGLEWLTHKNRITLSFRYICWNAAVILLFLATLRMFPTGTYDGRTASMRTFLKDQMQSSNTSDYEMRSLYSYSAISVGWGFGIPTNLQTIGRVKGPLRIQCQSNKPYGDELFFLYESSSAKLYQGNKYTKDRNASFNDVDWYHLDGYLYSKDLLKKLITPIYETLTENDLNQAVDDIHQAIYFMEGMGPRPQTYFGFFCGGVRYAYGARLLPCLVLACLITIYIHSRGKRRLARIWTPAHNQIPSQHPRSADQTLANS